MATGSGGSGGSRGHSGRSSGLASIGLVLVVALGIWFVSGRDPGTATGQATPSSAPTSVAPGADPDSGLPYVDLGDLPPEARVTVHEIDTGGPYPYAEDGQTFGNYEGLLPTHDHQYYQEFTVDTPGSPDRGARRIIVGQGLELYWTADHYTSFSRIRR